MTYNFKVQYAKTGKGNKHPFKQIHINTHTDTHTHTRANRHTLFTMFYIRTLALTPLKPETPNQTPNAAGPTQQPHQAV